jgi:hypothetical protein
MNATEIIRRHYQRIGATGGRSGTGKVKARTSSQARAAALQRWKQAKPKTREQCIQSFWEHVNVLTQDECWEWQGAKTGMPGMLYGTIKINKKRWTAHRLAYVLHFGEIPAGMLVCHTCDNPPCCNPRHLFLGTHKDNHQDMLSKQRGNPPRGDTHPHAKLSEMAVREIRRRYKFRGVDDSVSLAKEFGVSQRTIRDAANKSLWKHVKE